MRKTLLCGSIMATVLLGTVHCAAVTLRPLLVNKQHPIRPLRFEPMSLATPPVPLAESASNPEMELNPIAGAALNRLFEAGQAHGFIFVLSSGYRSYQTQARLYAQAPTPASAADELVAPPGYSEHQTGLAADVITSDFFCAAQTCFALTRAAAWLHDNAYHYGFIVRYPLGQEASTGYAYEPWHLRYVGVSIAQTIQKNQQTFEQFYGLP